MCVGWEAGRRTEQREGPGEPGRLTPVIPMCGRRRLGGQELGDISIQMHSEFEASPDYTKLHLRRRKWVSRGTWAWRR